MYKAVVGTIVLLSVSLRQVVAQGTTTPIVPFSTCDITTFLCDSGVGCCPINGCCGGGCCELGYTCINEGTSDATCCPSFDVTQCGTIELVSCIRGAIHSFRCSISHKNTASNILISHRTMTAPIQTPILTAMSAQESKTAITLVAITKAGLAIWERHVVGHMESAILVHI
jgi:hypothetical protein